MQSKAKRVATLGILVALAMIFSFVEAKVPVFVAIPGMKLGITNIVVVCALYLLGTKEAGVINAVRIVLMAILFGTIVSLWYALAGGMLSLLVMVILKRTNKFSIVTVSILGAIAHNVGQIIVAMILVNTTHIVWYLCVLWLTGIVAGAVIGLLSATIVKRLNKKAYRN